MLLQKQSLMRLSVGRHWPVLTGTVTSVLHKGARLNSAKLSARFDHQASVGRFAKHVDIDRATR
jgi:hypothetical protein